MQSGGICRAKVVYTIDYGICCASLLQECTQYHGHKEDLRVKLGTCGAIGERVQVILV